MSKTYKPRRAGARWLQDAPDYVLDVLDDGKSIDRYTVFFGGALLIHDGEPSPGSTRVPYLAMSGNPTHPQGFSQWGELRAYEAAGYRYRHGRHRIRWLDLPENIRAHVKARVENDD